MKKVKVIGPVSNIIKWEELKKKLEENIKQNELGIKSYLKEEDYANVLILTSEKNCLSFILQTMNDLELSK